MTLEERMLALADAAKELRNDVRCCDLRWVDPVAVERAGGGHFLLFSFGHLNHRYDSLVLDYPEEARGVVAHVSSSRGVYLNRSGTLLGAYREFLAANGLLERRPAN